MWCWVVLLAIFYGRSCKERSCEKSLGKKFDSPSAEQDLDPHSHQSPNLSQSLEHTLSLYSCGTEWRRTNKFTRDKRKRGKQAKKKKT